MRRIFLYLAVAVLTLGTATTALADTPPQVTRTVTVNVVASFPVTGAGACSGQVTVDVTEVFRSTDFGNGVVMLTDRVSGTATLVSDASGMTYTGRFSEVTTLESVPPGAAFAFTDSTHFRVTAPDGSSLGLTFVSHDTRTPSGTITVALDNPVCSG